MKYLTVDVAHAGKRLDQVLSLLEPSLGLRGRRRLIAEGLVLRNGRPGRAAERLRLGDSVALQSGTSSPLPQESPRLLSRQGDLLFFYKPAGLHTVSLAGSHSHSLQGVLPDLLADAEPQLLQRLDHGTSGLVCAASTRRAAELFRQAESNGQCEKRYVALLDGQLLTPQVVKVGLDVDSRRKSRILSPVTDAARWTEFLPLYSWQGPEAISVLSGLHTAGTPIPRLLAPSGHGWLTLVGCRIRRGARHQIRAHAAFLGLPLWGDSLYQTRSSLSQQHSDFFLHHGLLRLPGVSESILPSWGLPDAALDALRKWFEK